LVLELLDLGQLPIRAQSVLEISNGFQASRRVDRRGELYDFDCLVCRCLYLASAKVADG
jgi:hypothetical protein